MNEKKDNFVLTITIKRSTVKAISMILGAFVLVFAAIFVINNVLPIQSNSEGNQNNYANIPDADGVKHDVSDTIDFSSVDMSSVSKIYIKDMTTGADLYVKETSDIAKITSAVSEISA